MQFPPPPPGGQQDQDCGRPPGGWGRGELWAQVGSGPLNGIGVQEAHLCSGACARKTPEAPVSPPTPGGDRERAEAGSLYLQLLLLLAVFLLRQLRAPHHLQ